MRVARKILTVTLAVFMAIGFILCALSFSLLIADGVCEQYARILPSYDREDILETLNKEIWSEEDYDFLYRQTGLTREPLDALKDTPEKILAFQDALYYRGTIKHQDAAPTTPHDYIPNYAAPIAPLKDGDVLVTSACHTYGWRNGHAAIIVDAKRGILLESIAPGMLSDISTLNWFQHSSNFIILRMKGLTDEQRTEIAVSASQNLFHLPYTLTVGIFSDKDQGLTPSGTHCSHLVWQAYKNFGIDIDSNGGKVVTAHDIAQCDLFEVVQVYGFDPIELW